MAERVTIKGWKHAAIAAAVAYALVLQALLLSFSGAFHAAAAEAQAIICVQDGTSAPVHSPEDAHGGLCCILSCNGSGAAGPVPILAPPERLTPTMAAIGAPGDPSVLPTSPKVLPLGSRAPPRLG
jgi:hypothetical protein